MRASMSLRLRATCLGPHVPRPCSAVLALELSVSCPKSSIAIYASRVRDCQSSLRAGCSKASIAAPLHSATACQVDSLARFVSMCRRALDVCAETCAYLVPCVHPNSAATVRLEIYARNEVMLRKQVQVGCEAFPAMCLATSREGGGGLLQIARIKDFMALDNAMLLVRAM